MQYKEENTQWDQVRWGLERTRGKQSHGHLNILETFTLLGRVRGHSSITICRFCNFGQMMEVSRPGNCSWLSEVSLWKYAFLPRKALGGGGLYQGGQTKMRATEGREKQAVVWGAPSRRKSVLELLSRLFVLMGMSKEKKENDCAIQQLSTKISEVLPECITMSRYIQWKDIDPAASELCFELFNKMQLWTTCATCSRTPRRFT